MNPPESLNLWIDETNAQEWSEACQREIGVWLSVLAGQDTVGRQAEIAKNLKIEVRPPSREAAEMAYEQNVTLTGEIGFRWFDEERVLRFPMPYHGVFLRHRPGSKHPLAAVWPSWLADRSGFRIVRPNGRDEPQWRLGLPDGRWVGAKFKKNAEICRSDRPRDKVKVPLHIGNPGDFPEWLREALSFYGPRGVGKKPSATLGRAWSSIHRLVMERYGDHPEDHATDEDDLEHRVLVTFPVWLKQRINAGLLTAVLQQAKSEKDGWRRDVQQVLGGVAEGNEALGLKARDAIWEALPALGRKINWAINNYRSGDRADYIDPVNPLELVSRITRVRRIHLPASRLEEKAAVFRQNHPSFEGRICPVESPESGQVGLTVQLASGASVDFNGTVVKATTDEGCLGFGAALVPFFAHNDGARNMMGAKNLRQAIPVRGAVPPKVRTGGEKAVAAFARPLVEAGICPVAGETTEDFCVGRDLLVAYLPWYGLNFEDAVVLGSQVAEAGLLDCSGFRKRVRRRIKLGWVPGDPENPDRVSGLVDGLVPVRSRISAGAPIACLKREGREHVKERVIRYNERTPVVVTRIEFQRRSEWTGGVLEYELELPVPVGPGDKLMGRHGNKGVIGAVLPSDGMPRLPDDASIPEHLRDRTVDILLNPHGVISRMNLGQLLETHLGWLLESGVPEGELLKSGPAAEKPLAAAYFENIDHDKIQAKLEQTGLDRYGRVKLVLPDGSTTTAPVTVGFQHMVRLRHIPELKSQARRGGGEALYSARTGQAIRGRRRGGGQRVGEMEIWALAAHRAGAVIAEMLGIKSSAEMVAGKDGRSLGGPNHTGYARVFKDWLFAMGIGLIEEGESVALRFLSSEAVLDRVGEDREVTTAGGLSLNPTARFHCLPAGKKGCDYEVLDGERIAFSGGSETSKPTLKLADVLLHFGFKPAGALRESDSGRHVLKLADRFTGKEGAVLEFEFDCHGDTVSATARFSVPDADAPASAADLKSLGEALTKTSPEKVDPLPQLWLRGRFGRGEDVERNWSADELLQQFLAADPSEWLRGSRFRKGASRCVTDLNVVCPQHATSSVIGESPFGHAIRSAPGGLFDPGIFGDWSGGFRSEQRWGYIRLPIEVEFPLHVFLTGSLDRKDQEKAVAKFFESLGMDADARSLPKIKFIPVLPTHYRLPSFEDGRMIREDIERKAYGPLLASCRAYAEAPPDKQSKAAGLIISSVEWLFRFLLRALEGKEGLIRRDGLGRRVDRSARLVVTPNPELEWDEVGVPTKVLLETMGDIVGTWFDHLTAEEKRGYPNLPDWSWARPSGGSGTMRAAKTVFESFFEAHPGFVVLLNRQPSLHRDSFQAFKPRPLPESAGEVIQLCPLACKGFGADFDGDEMVLHVPVGEQAQREASTMMPSANPYSFATECAGGKNLLVHFDQDFVLGNWLLTTTSTGKDNRKAWLLSDLRTRFLEQLPAGECRELAEAWDQPDGDDGAELLLKLYDKDKKEAPGIIAKWMRLSFEACSRAGVSFGFYELQEAADLIRGKVEAQVRHSLAALEADDPSERDPNAPLGKLAEEALQMLVERALDRQSEPESAWTSPGLLFAAMALSGARGRKQVRQLIAARGYLGPGATGFDAEARREKFFHPRNLVDGLDKYQAFWAAMNARSSMIDKKLGTGFAGGLTRSMVFALWSYAIVSGDCESDRPEGQRNPATCRCSGGCCARCYGPLPDGSSPAVGFPAGLIAAQSIGERGTQLSMQSFHSGASGVSIHGVRAFLNSPDVFEDVSGWERFTKELREENAYADILPRHFHILWRVIHESGESKLSSAVMDRDPLTVLGFRHNRAVLAQALMGGNTSERHGPVSMVLLGGFNQPIETRGEPD